MNNINDFVKLFPKKDKILLCLVLVSTFLVSAFESISLGSLAGYVMIISDTEQFINKIPFENLKNYVTSISPEKFVVISSILLIVIFVLKNLIILFFNFVNIWIEKRILVNLSKELLNFYLT